MTPGSTIRCLNCDAALAPGQPFCDQCGQKADTRRLHAGDIAHAALHFLTHAEHGLFGLVRQLAVRPGRVAREYVAGRRRRYINPFTFVLVVVGVASLVMASTRFVDFTRGAPANPVSAFLQRNLNLLILLQLPMLALASQVLFLRSGLRFTEHLVLASYASGFRSIFFTLVVLPAWAFAGAPYGLTVSAYLALWLAYFGVACAQFYEGNKWWCWVKGVAVGLAAQLATTGLIYAALNIWFRLR